jgi:hypothetical protein
VHEQAFEHGVDRRRLPEHALEPSPAAAGKDDRQVARTGVSEVLSVEDERHSRLEEGVADDELAALRDLDDDAFRQVRL